MGDIESLFIMTILTLIVSFGCASEWDKITVPISKDGCESKCGNVTVPFPFGMGNPDCFLDTWFQVTCNHSLSPPTLLLKRTHLEVLDITYFGDSNFQQNVVVKGPISVLNCSDHNKTNPRGLNLTGSPFWYSRNNVFVAIGCEVRVNSHESYVDKVVTLTGCSSVCHQNTSCDCCHTSLRSSRDSYSIDLESTVIRSEDGDDCRFALVSNDYVNQSKSFVGTLAQDYVHLTLAWKVDNAYYRMFKNRFKYAKDKTRYCEYLRFYAGMEGIYCTCFEMRLLGNPYLPNGCTQELPEVNECEQPNTYTCDPDQTCVNTRGGFYCSNKRKYLIIGFGSSLGALFLLFVLWGSYKCIKSRKDQNRKRSFFKKNGGLLLQQQISSNEGNLEKTKLFNSDELEKATDRFSADRILGKGGQGTVYKGMLEDGKIVAVKKSTSVDESKLSEFINEVVVLSQINHRNVVQLLGCCLETEVPILVYEFIPNGTLSEYIHEQSNNAEFPFTWKMRTRIASEVAGALSYLHSAAAFPIYHRDIKSTNILLDEKFKAKVADFGTSRTISLEQTHLTTLVYGTFGYLDPEYFQSSQFTEKSDVYSFGVVLAELMTGQKAICSVRAEEGRNLATYFMMAMEGNALFDIVDARVLEDGPKEEIEAVACLALTCLSFSGRNRPTMKEVAMDLERLHNHDKEKKTTYELEYVGVDLNESWDVTTASPDSAVDRSLLLHELPLLSMESR